MTAEKVVRRYRVRGYEVGPDRRVSLPTWFSWLEQLRWEWILDPDWGLLPHLHEGSFFVVQQQALEVLEGVGIHQLVRVEGVVERVGRSQVFIRHHLYDDHTGNLVAHARVMGLWLGPNRRLARLPTVTRDTGRSHAPWLESMVEVPTSPGDTSPRRDSFLVAPPVLTQPRGVQLDAPEEAQPALLRMTRVVRPAEIDVFDHANHSAPIRWAVDLHHAAVERGLPVPRGTITRGALRYQRECLRDMELELGIWPVQDGGFAIQALHEGSLMVAGRFDVSAPHG